MKSGGNVILFSGTVHGSQSSLCLNGFAAFYG